MLTDGDRADANGAGARLRSHLALADGEAKDFVALAHGAAGKRDTGAVGISGAVAVQISTGGSGIGRQQRDRRLLATACTHLAAIAATDNHLVIIFER